MSASILCAYAAPHHSCASRTFLKGLRYIGGLALIGAIIVASAPAKATSGFVGPWDPSSASLNTGSPVSLVGFERAVQSAVSTFVVTLSPDQQTLYATLANNGDQGHPSFFLQNYSDTLPPGSFSYDFSITLESPTGFVSSFDDFGRTCNFCSSGTVLSGQRSGVNPDPSFPYPYFGFFGINIDDGLGSARATVVLTNFTHTPVPGPLPVFGAAMAWRSSRLLRRRLRQGAFAVAG